jgi:hypothetical protein
LDDLLGPGPGSGNLQASASLAADQDGGDVQEALASFRNLAINTFRLAGRANIAHASRDLLHRDDAFAVYNI